MTARKTKRKRVSAVRPVQHPQRRQSGGKANLVLLFLPIGVILVALFAGAILLSDDSPPRSPGSRSAGLPNSPDYHSLLVAPTDSAHLVLGTHAGLFESRDGGKTWARGGLRDNDAMNLVRVPGKATWAAGHGVLAKSTDGGLSWREVSPAGLPFLDVHGFAADPSRGRLYAAIAGRGLYRSDDDGDSFQRVSDEVGPDVFGLAVTPDGKLFAGDLKKGLMVSADSGRSWSRSLRQSAIGVAVNPKTPNVVLVTTSLGIFRSETEGRTWKLVFPIAQGSGPLAWAPSNPRLAYAVGFDQRLYRSADEGAHWKAVGAG